MVEASAGSETMDGALEFEVAVRRGVAIFRSVPAAVEVAGHDHTKVDVAPKRTQRRLCVGEDVLSMVVGCGVLGTATFVVEVRNQESVFIMISRSWPRPRGSGVCLGWSAAQEEVVMIMVPHVPSLLAGQV